MRGFVISGLVRTKGEAKLLFSLSDDEIVSLLICFSFQFFLDSGKKGKRKIS
jgi:hypothetical protein